MTIPRVLHRVVLPPMTPNADPAGRYWRRFARLHPGWEMRTWTEVPADWEVAALVSSCNGPAQIADVLRVEILWREGGFYVDTDVEPVKSFEPLREHRLVIGVDHDAIVGTAVIGAEPGHPALRAYLDVLPGRLPSADPVNVATGPILADQILRGRPDVTVLDREGFYPEHYNARFNAVRRPARTYRRSFAVHRWAHSWGGDQPTFAAKVQHTRHVVQAAVKRLGAKGSRSAAR